MVVWSATHHRGTTTWDAPQDATKRLSLWRTQIPDIHTRIHGGLHWTNNHQKTMVAAWEKNIARRTLDWLAVHRTHFFLWLFNKSHGMNEIDGKRQNGVDILSSDLIVAGSGCSVSVCAGLLKHVNVNRQLYLPRRASWCCAARPAPWAQPCECKTSQNSTLWKR